LSNDGRIIERFFSGIHGVENCVGHTAPLHHTDPIYGISNYGTVLTLSSVS